MTETQFLGMLVVSLGSLVSLFLIVYEPLSKNTKAMTELTMKIEFLTSKISEQEKKQEKYEKEFEEYKEHVSQGQQKQWDEINKHSETLARHEALINNDLKGE